MNRHDDPHVIPVKTGTAAASVVALVALVLFVRLLLGDPDAANAQPLYGQPPVVALTPTALVPCPCLVTATPPHRLYAADISVRR